MGFIKDNRAQVSLEVLIMIAGAIVVVTVVGIVVKNMAVVGAEKAAEEEALPP